jgi:hypothetical protein
VVPEGSTGHNNVCDDDPYNFIYQNLPQKHILTKVPNCVTAMHCSFSMRHWGFVVEKEKYRYVYQRFLKS